MSKSLDRELNLKAIIGFAVGLLILCAASAVALWYFSGLLRGYYEAQDPPPPVLEAARANHTPPGPSLQADPIAEIKALRDREDEVLEGYGWVDEAGGIARIPVERAITLTVGDDGPPAEPAGAVEEAEH